MHNPKIDFLKEKYELQKPDQKPFIFFGRSIVTTLVVLAVLGTVFSYHVATTTENTSGIPTPFSLFAAIKSFLTPNDAVLNGESEDRVNILLTGIGGEGHDGPQLTDTMEFASYRPSTKKLALMSLPRDLTVPIPGHGYQKINHENAYIEAEKPGTGAAATAAFVGNLLNQPVQYYVRVDFSGYEELVNSLGGVDVYIDKTFTDPDYPIIGKELDTCGNSKASMNPSSIDSLNGPAVPPANYSCRFESRTFKQGWMHMDGVTALAYARSRHGNNGEGSDFARSRRQQKILIAAKDKVFSFSTFLNPLRVTGILDTLQKNISTNFTAAEMIRLATDLKDLKSDEVANHVLDNSPNSPLYETTVNGAYVLLPKNDDWTPIKQMAQYIFTSEKTVDIALKSTPAKSTAVETVTTSKPAAIPVHVEIQNGTNVAGLAFRASQLLNGQQDFDVTKVGNAPTRNFTHTIIYDLTNGQKVAELKSLQTFFKSDLSLSASGWNVNTDVVPKELSLTGDDIKQMVTGSNIDFLVILGQNSQNFALK